jgi:hypothetical protein
VSKMLVTVFNKLHFPVEVSGYVFHPFQEEVISIESTSMKFRKIRATKGLRVGRADNEIWKRKNPIPEYDFCMVYDTNPIYRTFAYKYAIESLADPIVTYLPEGSFGYSYRPGINLNLRFFSEFRITQQGKYPIGPYDVFMSHGIGDKDYWIASRISMYRHVLVPGPAWKKRIEKGGYKGAVHVVGYTKLDPIFNGEYIRQKREKPYVVWAPTHAYIHRHRGRSSYPQCLTLINQIPNCYEKALAMHPAARLRHTGKQDITMQELLDADVVIADAGSTLYEAWALGKPVIFPDWLCKGDVLSHFQPGNLEYEIYSKGIGYHAKDMKHLIELIEVALKNGMRQPEIDFIEEVFPSELRGRAGRKAAEVLMGIKEDFKC